MTPMQKEAFAFVAANPRSTPDEIADAVGVKGGLDNRAKFLWRLLNTGRVFVTVGVEYDDECDEDDLDPAGDEAVLASPHWAAHTL